MLHDILTRAAESIPSSSPPPPDSAGLREFSLVLPSPADLDALVARLEADGVAAVQTADGPLLRDPSHNALLLTTLR